MIHTAQYCAKKCLNSLGLAKYMYIVIWAHFPIQLFIILQRTRFLWLCRDLGFLMSTNITIQVWSASHRQYAEYSEVINIRNRICWNRWTWSRLKYVNAFQFFWNIFVDRDMLFPMSILHSVSMYRKTF